MTNPPPERNLMRVKDTAARLGVSLRTVGRLLDRGQLLGVYVDPDNPRSKRRVDIASVDAYERRREDRRRSAE